MAMRDINPNSVRISTSKTEVSHILISSVVMAAAFAIIFSRNTSYVNYFKYHLGNDMWILGLAGLMFVIVILSFVGHELGHKFVAQKYGMWSEYRMFPLGLAISFAMSFLGFMIAAPGAVMIRGNFITKEQNGRISIAGPMVNIVLAVIGLIGVLLCNNTALLIPFYILMHLNAALALFNLLPFGPLDGAKVMAWNTPVWAGCIVISVILFFSNYFLPTLYWA